MSKIIVSKFGGASMADADKIKRTVDIITSNPDRRYVVVSAPGSRNSEDVKMTDLLFILNSRYLNRENFNEMLEKIRDRFSGIVQGLGISFDVDAEITSLKKNLFFGRGNDYVVSRGEYIIAKILSEYLGWPFIDAANIIYFSKDGSIDRDKTFSTTAEILKDKEHAIIPGFYGSTGGTGIKLFPLGGGDTTAAVIARAVNAEICEKWSETTKIYSADPSIVENPSVIRHITYEELKQLSYMGIRVFHEDVIYLMQGIGIPIVIKNINDINDEGTYVTSELPAETNRNVAACIAGKRNYRIIHIQKFGLNRLTGIGQKVFGIFTERKILRALHVRDIPIFDSSEEPII